MESDEDSITLSMDEYARLQTEMLTLKHENLKFKEGSEKFDEVCRNLKETSEKYEEVCKSFKNLQSEQSRLLGVESEYRKQAKFNREVFLDCLKSVRRQEEFDKAENLLIEQILAIAEYMWPKGGEQDLKLSDLQDLFSQTELKLLKESNQKLKNNLEALEEKYKMVAFSLESTAKENLEQGKKILDLESKKEHLIIDLAAREEEVVDARKQLKEMFALECSKQELSLKLTASQKEIDSLKKELESSTGSANQQDLEKLKIDLEEAKNNENLVNLEYANLKTSAKQTLSELALSKSQVRDLELSLKKIEDTLKKTQQEFEDMKTERQIIQKRSMNDLKDLKSELAKEKSLHELCKMDKEKVMQENRKLQESLRAGVKLPPPTHQEKVLVESMSHRMGELEKENLALRHKIRDIECFVVENERLINENDELRAEILKLGEDMAMMGAQFNEYIRKSKTN